MTHRTAEESLIEYKQKMGEGLGEAFHFCKQQLIELSIIWDQHETLFQNRKRVELLNSSGGLLSFNIQRIFYNWVVLGLMRLLDPPSTGKNKNLVLWMLADLANENCQKKSEEIVQQLRETAVQLAEARNKVLAHNDYQYSTNREILVDIGSRLLLTNSLKLVLKFLNIFELAYCDSQTMIFPLGNHDALLHLHYLDQGLRLRAKIESDVKSGVSDWREFQEPIEWLRLGKNEDERYC